MNDFWASSSGEDITKQVAGKTIAKCEVIDAMDSILQFTFSDGSFLNIRYDWIYEWEVVPSPLDTEK